MQARDTGRRRAAPRSWLGVLTPTAGPTRVTSALSGSPLPRGMEGAASMVVAGRPEATPKAAAARAMTLAAGGLRAVTTRGGLRVAIPMVAAAPRAGTTAAAVRLVVTVAASGRPAETQVGGAVHPVVEAAMVVGGVVGVVAGVARRLWAEAVVVAAVVGVAECEGEKSPRKVRGLFHVRCFQGWCRLV